MAADEYYCWKCGEVLTDLLLPVPRQAKCLSCKADIHVCCQCEFYDTTVSNSCSEPIAEKVTDKKRANFCGYFQPLTGTTAKDNTRAEESRASLNALFGLDEGNSPVSSSDANQSLKELDALFGLDDKKEE